MYVFLNFSFYLFQLAISVLQSYFKYLPTMKKRFNFTNNYNKSASNTLKMTEIRETESIFL